MSTLTISDELMATVQAVAAHLHTTPDALAAELLRRHLPMSNPEFARLPPLNSEFAPPTPLSSLPDSESAKTDAEEERQLRAMRRLGQRAAKWIDDAW